MSYMYRQLEKQRFGLKNNGYYNICTRYEKEIKNTARKTLSILIRAGIFP